MSGQLTSYDRSGPIRSATLGKGAAFVWCDEDNVYVIDSEGFLNVLDWRTLEPRTVFRVTAESPTCAPILAGGKAYLFHGEHTYTVFDPKTGWANLVQHGYGRVSQACSLATDRKDYAIVVCAEGSTQYVRCFDLEGGAQIARFYEAPKESVLRFIVSEDSVHVAVSGPGDVRIRSYALV